MNPLTRHKLKLDIASVAAMREERRRSRFYLGLTVVVSLALVVAREMRDGDLPFVVGHSDQLRKVPPAWVRTRKRGATLAGMAAIIKSAWNEDTMWLLLR